MSSSNSQMRHKKKKKKRLCSRFGLSSSESPREEGDYSALVDFFERSRIASVEIPIVRVRASFASHHPRVRKKIGNFIKRGGTNQNTVDLQSSL